MVTRYIMSMEQIQEHWILLALWWLLKSSRILMEHLTERACAMTELQKPWPKQTSFKPCLLSALKLNVFSLWKEQVASHMCARKTTDYKYNQIKNKLEELCGNSHFKTLSRHGPSPSHLNYFLIVPIFSFVLQKRTVLLQEWYHLENERFQKI